MKVPRVYQLCKMYYRNNHGSNCICLLQTELCYHAYFVMLIRVYKKKKKKERNFFYAVLIATVHCKE